MSMEGAAGAYESRLARSSGIKAEAFKPLPKATVTLANEGGVLSPNGATLAKGLHLLPEQSGLLVESSELLDIEISHHPGPNGLDFLLVVKPGARVRVSHKMVGEGEVRLDTQIDRDGQVDQAIYSFNSGEQVWLSEVKQGRGSLFRGFCLLAGLVRGQHELRVRQEEEGAETSMEGVYLVSEGQSCDVLAELDHQKPHGRSQQHYRGVLLGDGRSSFCGGVKIHPGSHKCAAAQMNRNLLLSTRAQARTKPQLQVDADDVKCSHGAAVGPLRADELFYLQSRGIPKWLAKGILCQGFVQAAVQILPSNYRSWVGDFVEWWLEQELRGGRDG